MRGRGWLDILGGILLSFFGGREAEMLIKNSRKQLKTNDKNHNAETLITPKNCMPITIFTKKIVNFPVKIFVEKSSLFVLLFDKKSLRAKLFLRPAIILGNKNVTFYSA